MTQLAELTRLLADGSIWRMEAIARRGIPAATVRRAVAAGDVDRLSRGTYRRAGLPLPPGLDLALVAVRAPPSSVFCLYTAAAMHGLGEMSPSQVWLAMPNSARPPRMEWPRIRPVRWRSPTSFSVGVETRIMDGVEIRLTGPARTVTDMLRMRSLLGEDRALETLRDYAAGGGSLTEIREIAAHFPGADALTPYLNSFAYI